MNRGSVVEATRLGLDRLIALCLIVVLLPLLLIIALAVKLDTPGPVFFCQPRFGIGGKVIRVTKFRTMRADAADLGGKQQAAVGDARVTRVGRFLRPTCLDELPQLFDVLCGRMALVGPRPHPLELEVDGVRIDDLVPSYHERHRIRPGMTGLAQINGNRGPVTTLQMCIERINYDLRYIQETSISLDTKIIIKTILVLFQKRNIYRNKMDEYPCISAKNVQSDPRTEPLVSVVVCAYNSERTIGRTLDSISSQTYRNLEIIVVDDGSLDESGEIARRHAQVDSRVRVIRIENRGVAGARNAGIAASRGAFIAPVDADDIWHPDKIRRQMDVMRENDRVGLAYTLYRRIDADDRVIFSCPEEAFSGPVFIRSILYNFVGNGSSLLLRRTAVDEVGGYSTALATRGMGEDWLIQILVARNWEVGCVPEYLTGYRQSPGSLSSDEEKQARGLLGVIDYLETHVPEAPGDALTASRAGVWLRLCRTRLGAGEIVGAARAARVALALDPGLAWSIVRAAGLRKLAGLGGREAPMFALAGRPFHNLDPAAGRVVIDRGFRVRNAKLAPRDRSRLPAFPAGGGRHEVTGA